MQPEVVLQHPVVPAGLRVKECPDARHIGRLQGQSMRLHGAVEQLGAGVPAFVQALVNGLNFGGVQLLQEGRHGPHDGWMRVEGATRKANIGRSSFIEAAHPFALAAHHTHWKTAAQCFAIGDQIGLHAKVGLCTTCSQSEAQKHFVKNQGNAAFGADLAQGLEPSGVSRAVVRGPAAAVDQGRVAWCVDVGVQGLQGVDQHTGNVFAAAQNLQAALAHVTQGVGLARGRGVARAGLHVFPPAVVSPAKTHNVFAACVVTGQAHGLHHGFGARHVKRYFVQARDGLEALGVARHHGVVRAQHRPQRLGACHALGHGVFVKVGTEHVHAVRAGQVIKLLAIKVGDMYALGRLPKRADFQVLAHHRAELEGHAVGRDELHVRDVLACSSSGLDAQAVPRLQCIGQSKKCRTALRLNIAWRTVAAKKLGFVEAVARQPACQSLGHARVACQRAVFGTRELNAPMQARGQSGQDAQTDPSGVHCNLLVTTKFLFIQIE